MLDSTPVSHLVYPQRSRELKKNPYLAPSFATQRTLRIDKTKEKRKKLRYEHVWKKKVEKEDPSREKLLAALNFKL